MTNAVQLDRFLDLRTNDSGALRAAVNETVLALAGAGAAIADLIAAGRLAGDLAAMRGESAHGDSQKELDVRANEIVLDALRDAPVAAVASEEIDEPLVADIGAPLAIAVDPLDGSSNIDTNAPIGTIFSILPVPEDCRSAPADALFQPGSRQLAAGFLIYGPHTALVLTTGDGTQIFTLDRGRGEFLLTTERATIPPDTSEYAINASNRRHWEDSVRLYIRDCLQGATGPRGKDFNTRWLASLVGEAYRIMLRGGVYLYPRDARRGYRNGRLRLLYEANPVAWLVEQAGGMATDGSSRILDLVPESLHQRVPLVFGSRSEVTRVAAYHADVWGSGGGELSPLFGQRSVFRT
jgi:fructose-1,6-bisphosphatase I